MINPLRLRKARTPNRVNAARATVLGANSRSTYTLVANRPPRPSESSNSSPFSEQLRQSSGSFEMVLSVVIFGGLGWYLDRRFGTRPWLAIVFSLLAAFGSIASVYYRYRHQVDELRRETEALRVRKSGVRQSGVEQSGRDQLGSDR